MPSNRRIGDACYGPITPHGIQESPSSFSHASALDGIPSLLLGLFLTVRAFRPVPPAIAADPRLARHRSWQEYLTFAGPGLSIASVIYMLVRASL